MFFQIEVFEEERVFFRAGALALILKQSGGERTYRLPGGAVLFGVMECNRAVMESGTEPERPPCGGLALPPGAAGVLFADSPSHR